MKVCSKCKKSKESTEFGRDLRYNDSKRCWCRECDRKRSEKSNQKRKEIRQFQF